MICRDVRQLLPPYSDGELDLVRRLQIEEHLTDCADCATQEKNLRSLRAVLSSPALYHRAPPGLRARVQLAAPPAGVGRRRPRIIFAALAAGSLLLIGVSATLIGMFGDRAGTADDRIAELVVAGHLRSLQVEHLIDVPSSDRHVVKPWFRGKLDFSPQVPDLSAEGYPLTGGRLDYLADRPVAALVYKRRLHVVNLFTWPAGTDADKVGGLARRGFHLRSWQRAGMAYWAISDLNDQELDEFVRLFRERSAEAPP